MNDTQPGQAVQPTAPPSTLAPRDRLAYLFRACDQEGRVHPLKPILLRYREGGKT